MKNFMLTKKYLIGAVIIPTLFSSVAMAHSEIGVTDRQGLSNAEKQKVTLLTITVSLQETQQVYAGAPVTGHPRWPFMNVIQI